MIIGAAVVGFAISILASRPAVLRPSMWLVLAVLVAAAAIFARLTVEVERGMLQASFTPGWPRWRWPVQEISSARRVRNSAFIGWGLHWIPGFPGTWVINVSGYDAVELRMRTGRRYRVGTDDPEGLLDALVQAGVSMTQGS